MFIYLPLMSLFYVVSIYVTTHSHEQDNGQWFKDFFAIDFQVCDTDFELGILMRQMQVW